MTHVLVFAKAPREGFVKTRLARDIGAVAATRLYRQVGIQVVRQLKTLPLTIWFDPPDAIDEMATWLGAGDFRAQPSGDLAARLTFAFCEHFRQHRSPAVAVGMDAPGVDAPLVTRAFVALQGADVVLGPARDGGYYLIGLAGPTTAVFDDVDWSTSRVCEQTVARCNHAGLRVRMLDILDDMDTKEDAVALGLWPP